MEIPYSNFGNNPGHYSHVCNYPFEQDSKDAASGLLRSNMLLVILHAWSSG